MSLADLQTELVGRVMVARIRGELDMSNTAEIGSAISDRISNEVLGLVLDLEQVGYMDSAAIRMLFELRAGLKARGQEMRLVVPPGATIADVLQITDVPIAIGVSESGEAAVESIVAVVPQPGSDPAGES
jgi:anti-anti-sigma factor